MFKTQCDKNPISEGAALLLLPDFLTGDAEQVYQNDLELGDEGVGGITSYCHAVQFTLRRYAADRYIDRAVEELRTCVRRITKMKRHMPVDYEAKPSALVMSILRPTS